MELLVHCGLQYSSTFNVLCIWLRKPSYTDFLMHSLRCIFYSYQTYSSNSIAIIPQTTAWNSTMEVKIHHTLPDILHYTCIHQLYTHTHTHFLSLPLSAVFLTQSFSRCRRPNLWLFSGLLRRHLSSALMYTYDVSLMGAACQHMLASWGRLPPKTLSDNGRG